MPILNLPRKSENRSPLFNFFIQFFVIAIIFFAIGFTFGQKKVETDRSRAIPTFSIKNQNAGNIQEIDFSLFWKVFNELPDKYIDKSAFDSQKLLYGAISGMVRSLGDPYTAFLNPEQNEAIRSELAGSFEGIGIQIGFNRDKRLVVIAPLSQTPAERAGLKAKDEILKIGDKDAFDMTLPEAVDLIRGPAGTKVKLVLRHAGEDKSFEKELERTKITVKSVESSFKEKNGKQIAVLKVSRFGETTDKEWNDAVADALAKGASGVIVDMRNNPGGLLTSAIHLVGEFVTGTAVKQQFADSTIKSLPVDHQGKFLKMPVVVLVNGGSASASEIFAGAIQDNNRGKIVGEKTFGKGTVQDVVDLPGGSGLHVTVAKWLTPKGTSIHGAGITPDVEVKEEVTTGGTTGDDNKKDIQMDKALELI